VRPRLAALVCLLTLTACGGGGDDAAASGPPPADALLTLADSTDLGFAETGGTLAVQLAAVDSTGTPVLVGREIGSPSAFSRGPDLAGAAPLVSLGEYGTASALAVAPDDTAVLLALAAPGSDNPVPSVVRVAPDGTEQVLPIDGAADVLSSATVGFNTDATRAALAVAPRDTSQGFPQSTGALQLTLLDTTTGAPVGALSVPLTEPAAIVPGQQDPVRVDDVAIAPDGGVVVAVTVTGQSQLLRYDAALAPVGAPAELPRLEEFGGFLGLGPDGTAYVTTTGSEVGLVRVPAGATAAEPVATVSDGSGGVTGMVVDPAGGYAYLSGVTDLDLGVTVRAVDLATGETTPATQLCPEGITGQPVLDPTGTTLLVSGTCNEPTTLEAFVWTLTAA